MSVITNNNKNEHNTYIALVMSLDYFANSGCAKPGTTYEDIPTAREVEGRMVDMVCGYADNDYFMDNHQYKNELDNIILKQNASDTIDWAEVAEAVMSLNWPNKKKNKKALKQLKNV